MTDWTAMLAELEQKKLRELWRIADAEGIELGSSCHDREDAAGAIVTERRRRARLIQARQEDEHMAMKYERALVLVSGVWLRLWVPRSFRGVGTDAIMRCLADYDDHEVDVYVKHVGAIEWTGETQEVS